jgi:hypothetical protein
MPSKRPPLIFNDPSRLPGYRPVGLPAREIQLEDERWRDVTELLEAEGVSGDCDLMLIDERSGSYRELEKENLLVQRLPHEVRPPSHTGVQHRFNEATRVAELSLNDAPRLPEYEWTSMQLETEHNLCQACLDVFNYFCKYLEAKTAVSCLLRITVYEALTVFD